MNFEQATKLKSEKDFEIEKNGIDYYLFIVPKAQKDFLKYMDFAYRNFAELEDSDAIQFAENQKFNLLYLGFNPPAFIFMELKDL